MKDVWKYVGSKWTSIFMINGAEIILNTAAWSVALCFLLWHCRYQVTQVDLYNKLKTTQNRRKGVEKKRFLGPKPLLISGLVPVLLSTFLWWTEIHYSQIPGRLFLYSKCSKMWSIFSFIPHTDPLYRKSCLEGLCFEPLCNSPHMHHWQLSQKPRDNLTGLHKSV